MPLSRVRALLSFLLFALLSFGALADPPTRVARLAYVSGNASFSPGGERDWGRASINRPLTTGDRLWVDRDSRAELQLGNVALRADGRTNLTLLNVDDRVTQVQLTRGTLNVRVRQMDRGEVVEIDTPNLAFSIRRPGSYRIEVSPRDDATTVAVLQGRAQVFGDRRAFVVGERRSFVFYGAGLDDFESIAPQRPDDFDRWVAQRERRWENSPSRRFVPVDMIGFEDLDPYGSWRTVPQLGAVWIPRRVPADWAPYREGHWAWVDPWGWTWIDDEPWGFAPSHYGRWTRLDNTWAWVPGPADARPVYAPAVVAFVGNGAPGAGGTVAWFPLGPRDVYRPAYTTSRDYFVRLNASNARVDRQAVIAHFDNRGATLTYSNRQVPGAIIAVPASAFSQAQPVARVTIRIGDLGLRAGAVLSAPPVAPQRASLVGRAAAPAAQPPDATPPRPVVAQVAPPPPKPSFAAKQDALAANAGKPLDPAAVAAIKPAAAASAPAVKVVPETQAVEVPKTAASGSPAAAERRARRQRGGDAPAADAPGAAASAPAAAPAQAAPAPAASAPAAPPARAGRDGSAPGRDGSAPGREGTTPGREGSAPGRDGSAPGRQGSTPGRDGSAPGRPAAANAPAAPPAVTPPAATPPAAAPSAATRPAAEAPSPAASRPRPRGERARPAAPAASAPEAAASAPADAASSPRTGRERRRAREAAGG